MNIKDVLFESAPSTHLPSGDGEGLVTPLTVCDGLIFHPHALLYQRADLFHVLHSLLGPAPAQHVMSRHKD